MKLLTTASALVVMSSAVFAADGTVVDEQGNPVVGAEVSVIGSSVEALTDSNGKFSLAVDDIDEVHIEADGFAHQVIHAHGNDAALNNITLIRSVIEQTDVVGLPLHVSNIESALPVVVLKGEDLRRAQADTLGDTLANQLGVHSSAFAGVASRPVIRGLDGPRVKVTANSLDLSDVSAVGPDHVVAAETVVAEQVEILRGPATLFYGSGAIGGVVNVVDNRVPTSTETTVDAIATHNTVSDGDSAAFAANTGVGNFAFYADGAWRENEEYEIPVPAEAGEQGSGDYVLENSQADTHNFTLGTSAIFDSGYVGIAYQEMERLNGVPGHGHGHGEEEHGHEEEHEGEEGHEDEHEHEDEHGAEEMVSSELKQERWQFISDFDVDWGLVTGIDTRLAHTEYEHAEVHMEVGGEEAEEGHEDEHDHGEGTVFSNETTQLRIVADLAEMSGWKGALLLEGMQSEFSALGSEAFTPASETDSFAIALLQEKHVGKSLFQLGARFESVDINADLASFAAAAGHEDEHGHDEHEGEEDHDEEHEGEAEHEGEEHADEEHHDEEDGHEHEGEFDLASITANAPQDLSFNPFSLSAGWVYDYAEGYNIGISYSYAQRAPSSAELYSFGQHVATGTYELGVLYQLHEEEGEWHVDINRDVNEEISNNIDLTWRDYHGDFGFIVSVFYNDVDNFYFLSNTGLTSDQIIGGEEHHDEDEHHEDEHEGEEHEDEEHADEEHEDEHCDEHQEDGHDEHSGEGLPLFAYQQADVRLYGFEAQVDWQVTEQISWVNRADMVRGKRSNGGQYLPLQPADRWLTELNYSSGPFRAQVSMNYYFEQDRLGANETATDSFQIVNAEVAYDMSLVGTDLTWFASVNNAFDEEARVHTSILKDEAPLPGRGFKFGVRGSF